MGDKRLIDVETGEDLTHLYSLRSRKQDEAYRKKLEQDRTDTPLNYADHGRCGK